MYTYEKIGDEIKKRIDVALLESATISNPVKKGDIFKIKIKGVTVKGEACFQLSKYIDKRVLHENCDRDKLVDRIVELMRDGFKQCNIIADNYLTVLMNKKGEFSITGVKPNPNARVCFDGHNSSKNYILSDGELVPWMHSLGLMDENGMVVNHKQKKFRQINRFLEMLKDVEDNIPDNSVIVDMGCGKSYLTFAMYHYLNVIKNKNIEIMGFDLKADVVDYCNKLTADFGFDKLKFYAKDIADIDNIDGRISMIITLHACDTATDIALYHGIRWGCRVIMSVPCCQHELFKQIQNPDMDILLKHGILKERFSALMTDAIRAQILEIKGYKTSVMEFIDMEHTPKNIMIRAVKTKHEREGELSRLTKLMDEYSVKQKLYELCFERDNVE
jgi:hypothetical protein